MHMGANEYGTRRGLVSGLGKYPQIKLCDLGQVI